METTLSFLKCATNYLSKEGITSAASEAEIFLSYVLDCPRIELYLQDHKLGENSLRRLWQLLSLRATGYPLQYLLGTTEFMGLKFKLSPGIFIPRPETEILVETAIEILNHQLTSTPWRGFGLRKPIRAFECFKILDLGTGCGNIAISIAKQLEKKVHIFACDISDFALQLTQENAGLIEVRISLVKSDLFCGFKKVNYFSLIVSNPPYISAREIAGLTRELNYEPRQAYHGGEDGLAYYRRIAACSPAYLQDEGFLVLEIGDNQAESVREILAESKKFSPAAIIKDCNQKDRVIVVQKIRD